MNKIEMVGKTFGHLTVLNETKVKDFQTYYMCKCDCGNFKEIRGDALRSGRTVSCGCTQIETRQNFGNRVKKLVDYNGMSYPVPEFCKEVGIAPTTYYRGVKKGMTVEEIVKKHGHR